MVIMLGHLDRQFTDQTKHRGDSRVMCRHHRRARLERSVLWAEKAQTTLAVSQENGDRSDPTGGQRECVPEQQEEEGSQDWGGAHLRYVQ